MDTLSNENATGINNEAINLNMPLKYLTASSIIGDKIYNNEDEHLGKIADIMIDLATGKIEYVIIELGGFLTIGAKLFAIPFGLLKVNQIKQCFVLNQSREMLDNAPGFDVNHWPETNLHAEATYWSFMG